MDKEFSVLDFFMIFLRRKRFIVMNFLAIALLAVAVSYVIPKKYKSTAVFLPPHDDQATGSFTLGAMLNIGRVTAFSPQQLQTIINSRRIQESVIHEFDLIRVYKKHNEPNPMEQTLKVLKNRTTLNATSLSGITQNSIVHYSLSVIDRDSLRAAEMANFMLAQLNRVMDTLSRNQYEYTRDFVKSRLDSVIDSRNTMTARFADFQRKNKIYAPQIGPQIAASISAYADLKRQRLQSEIQRDLLLIERGKESREVKFEEGKMRELDQHMRELESHTEASVLPGLERSVDLSQEFVKLYQEIEVLGRLELLLRQQYEEARIKSARTAPTVRVIDVAKPPEWKNSPKKAIVVLAIVGVYMVLLLVYVLASHGVSRASPETLRKLTEFRNALRLRAR
jgi:tyrosine-protein kinase Etk/Wzc